MMRMMRVGAPRRSYAAVTLRCEELPALPKAMQAPAAATTAAGLTYFHHGRPIVFQDGKWQVFDAPIGVCANYRMPQHVVALQQLSPDQLLVVGKPSSLLQRIQAPRLYLYDAPANRVTPLVKHARAPKAPEAPKDATPQQQAEFETAKLLFENATTALTKMPFSYPVLTNESFRGVSTAFGESREGGRICAAVFDMRSKPWQGMQMGPNTVENPTTPSSHPDLTRTCKAVSDGARVLVVRSAQTHIDVWSFDLIEMRWSCLQTKVPVGEFSEDDRVPPRKDYVATILGGKLLIVGGTSKEPFALDLKTNEWQPVEVEGETLIAMRNQAIARLSERSVAILGGVSMTGSSNRVQMLTLE